MLAGHAARGYVSQSLLDRIYSTDDDDDEEDGCNGGDNDNLYVVDDDDTGGSAVSVLATAGGAAETGDVDDVVDDPVAGSLPQLAAQTTVVGRNNPSILPCLWVVCLHCWYNLVHVFVIGGRQQQTVQPCMLGNR